MKIFIDTSFFVEYFLGNEEAKNIYNKIRSKELYTSINVVEETTYILMKLIVSDLSNVDKHYEIIKKLKKDERVYETCLNKARVFYFSLIEEGVKILMPASWDITLEIMEKYKLLPNDALIAATCKHYGIKKIATFDEDFKKVEFLEVIKG